MNRRAVSPVIVTLIIVAVAVVGGSIIFIVSQGVFDSEDINAEKCIVDEGLTIENSTGWQICMSYDELYEMAHYIRTEMEEKNEP